MLISKRAATVVPYSLFLPPQCAEAVCRLCLLSEWLRKFRCHFLDLGKRQAPEHPPAHLWIPRCTCCIDLPVPVAIWIPKRAPPQIQELCTL